MHNPQFRSIKHSQKEAMYLREISKLIFQLTLDEPSLQGMVINRVQLSPNKGMCTVFFYEPSGEQAFREKLGKLILYKPSLRSALAKAISSRYVPEITFKFDTLFEKQAKLEALISQANIDSVDDEAQTEDEDLS